MVEIERKQIFPDGGSPLVNDNSSMLREKSPQYLFLKPEETQTATVVCRRHDYSNRFKWLRRSKSSGAFEEKLPGTGAVKKKALK